MFSTLLIANRGEIALRIARSCRELGIRTIAAYSSADADSEVVRVADAAIRIGPPSARRSYLDMSAVLSAALLTGAEAIHPGYGFLAEDPDFAEACQANGLVLVGPPAELMQQLGDKAAPGPGWPRWTCRCCPAVPARWRPSPRRARWPGRSVFPS